jgi:hypothetical protein
VRVSVNDVNDNFPEFAPTNYDVTVDAGASVILPEAGSWLDFKF